ELTDAARSPFDEITSDCNVCVCADRFVPVSLRDTRRMDQAWYSHPWDIWGFDPDRHSHRPGCTGSIENGCSRAPDHLLHWRKIAMLMYCRRGDDCDAGKPWEGNPADCSP